MRNLLARLHADPALLVSYTDSMPSDISSTKQIIARLELETSPDVVRERRRITWSLAIESTLGGVFLEEELSRAEAEQNEKVQRLSELRLHIAQNNGRQKAHVEVTQLLSRFWNLFDSATYDERRQLAEAVVAAVGPITATRDCLQHNGFHYK